MYYDFDLRFEIVFCDIIIVGTLGTCTYTHARPPARHAKFCGPFFLELARILVYRYRVLIRCTGSTVENNMVARKSSESQGCML